MFKRIRRPSPALVVSLIALFVALTGTAVASSIVARAHLADNALKLEGKSAQALIQQAGEVAGPASSAVGLVFVKSAPFTFAAKQQSDLTVACGAGAKAISGGYDESTGTAVSFDTRPSVDGGSWRIYLADLSDTDPASGTVYAVCLK